MKTIYISGKIGSDVITQKIYDKFKAAQDLFLEKGWRVFNPCNEKFQIDIAKHVGIEKRKHKKAGVELNEYSWILLYDLHMLAYCDAIYLLRDWSHSDGARTEYYFAVGSKKQIIFQDENDARMYTWNLCYENIKRGFPPPGYLDHGIEYAARKFFDEHKEEFWIPTE